jgi:4-hydroxybenzoate polyprenyltransferase
VRHILVHLTSISIINRCNNRHSAILTAKYIRTCSPPLTPIRIIDVYNSIYSSVLEYFTMLELITLSIRCITSIVIDIFAFSRSNTMFIICPPIALGTAQYLSGRTSISDLFQPYVSSLLYLYFYIVQFNISNDISGVEGDRIDKPWRPIPSNRISIERAWHLYYIMVVVYFVYSYMIDHLFACILWIVATIVYNFTVMHKTSLGKNGMMAPATYAMISVIWCVMNDVSDIFDHPKVLWNFIFNSCVTAAVAFQQDMRDVKGDYIQGRRTFSVTMGSPRAERFIAKIIFCVFLCLLLEASLVEQVRVVNNSTYVMINSLLYGTMIVRNWFSFDLRTTYEFYNQLTFFLYLFMTPVINT